MTHYKRVRTTTAGAVSAYRNEAGNTKNVPITDGRYAEVPDEATDDLLASSDMWTAVDAPQEEVVEGYSLWTNDELREELKARDLKVSGNKDELVARLEQDDAAEEDDSAADMAAEEDLETPEE